MQNSPATSASPLRGLATAGALLAGCAAAGGALAQSRPGNSHCAVYGADYVAVQGSSTCVRIGGRVRLDLELGSRASAFAPVAGAPAAATPFAAAPGDGLNRAHMRLGGGRAR